VRAKELVTIEEFGKLDIRVGIIIEVDPIPASKKLLRLKIDVGGGVVKQSVAGLAEFYRAEEMRGKLVAVLVNLKPKRICGVESEAMVLAAVAEDSAALLIPDRAVKEGTQVF